MKIETFRDMYVAELQELHSVEQQLAAALPRMAASASHPELKDAFNAQLADTGPRMERLAGIIRRHGTDPREHKDQSMQRLIDESERWKQMLDDAALRDVGLIDSAQRIAHYEIAAYGTAAAHAGTLGLAEDKSALHAMLEEEKACDRRLSELAKDTVNQDAAGA